MTDETSKIHLTVKTIEGKIVTIEHAISVDIDADYEAIKAKLKAVLEKLHKQPAVAPGAEGAPSPKV